MIEIESLPLKELPVRYLLMHLKEEPFPPFESAVVMPTTRSIRHLIHLISNDSSVPVVLPYCFEMKEFALRCLDSGGSGVVPDELRLLYLQKAVRGLDTENLLRLFGREHARYYEDFMRFASVGRRLLRFYEEVFAEGVGFEDLRINALYTDYEKDVMILEEIASIYRDILKRNGLIDLMFLKGDFLSSGMSRFYSPTFLKRFKKIYILIAGRLSSFELRLMEKASDVVDIKVFLHYEGVADSEIKRISRTLAGEASLPPEIPVAPYPAFIEVEEFSLPEEQTGFIMDSIRKSIGMGISPEETVVVLPDDGLKRTLHAFDRDGILNFAMGFEMRDTVFYSFLKSLETMLTSCDERGTYDTRAALNFLSHPFVRGLAGEGYELFVRDVKRRNRLFVGPEELCMTGELKEVFQEIEGIFSRKTGFKEFSSRIREFMGWIMERNSSLIEKIRESPEFVGACKVFFERLIMLGMLPYEVFWPKGSPLGHLVYLNEYIKSVTYPHTWGGPVTVMGMLETRALGFKAVIIPDMNEEFMPPASEKDMFLNTEIRKRVGLPTFLDREELSRTYFNGLLKKARAVFLSYAGSEGRRPKSRFIEEIAIQRGGGQFETTSSYSAGKVAPSLPTVSIQAKSFVPVKDSRVLRLIETMELTPTSLRTYRECKFRFYLKYIRKLREKEEISEELQRVDVGNIFHSAIKNVYSRLFGSSLQDRSQKTGIRKQKSEDGSQAGLFTPQPSDSPAISCEKLTSELKSEVLREAASYDIFRKSHHARLEIEVFIEKLRDFVDSEKGVFEAGWMPAYLEFPVSMKLKGMRFRGKIDRVDIFQGPAESARTRGLIIDYKLSEINVRDRTVLDENFKEFQLPLYRLMLRETIKGMDVEGLAYYDLKRSFRLRRVFEDLTDGEFAGHIEGLVMELRDREQGFEKTAQEKNCRYCSYTDICR
ncbi:MAG: PD-(D/E)XK nuclease family protein [Nitrospirota bacterium]|nr:PD-(D/E)XK nuclease family protein [Nitrospirota bacterium]